jgi:hypothetical protein
LPHPLDSLKADLEAHGVDPSDLGRFVNRVVPGIIEPSTFDAERATPVLLEWLPRLDERRPAVRRAAGAPPRDR